MDSQLRWILQNSDLPVIPILTVIQ